MVNPAAKVNARFSPLVVRVQLYVCSYGMCVSACTQKYIYFLCMSKEIWSGCRVGKRWKVSNRREDRKLRERDGFF